MPVPKQNAFVRGSSLPSQPVQVHAATGCLVSKETTRMGVPAARIRAAVAKDQTAL